MEIKVSTGSCPLEPPPSTRISPESGDFHEGICNGRDGGCHRRGYRPTCRPISATAFTLAFFLPRSWEFFWRVFRSPSERQVQLHSAHLLAQIENKDWSRVAAFIGDGHQDRWDMIGLRSSNGSVKFSATSGNPRLTAKDVSIRAESAKGFWRARITFKASGEFASVIEERVNSLPALRAGVAARIEQAVGLEIDARG
jgi:hypothetical protein